MASPRLPSEDTNDIRAYGTAIINTVKELVPLNPLYGEELNMFLARFKPSDPAPYADFAANLTTAGKEELQDVLETTQLTRRMENAWVLLKTELAVAKLQTRIRKVVEERMTDQQLTSFLKQQLKAIREEELGISKTIAPRGSR